jgi:hypothetical protein
MTWAKMTLWGVLLTSGVGKAPENTHTSFHSTLFYIALFYIDLFFDVIEDSVACMTDTSSLLTLLDITTFFYIDSFFDTIE